MVLPDWLYSIVLGIVQGITEFLPVSSSAHLIITSWLTDGKPLPIALNIALHIGTLVAVLIYFWRDWLNILSDFFARITVKKTNARSNLLLHLLVGSIPAAFVGFLWQQEIEDIFHNPMATIFPLAFVGFLLWWVDIKKSHTKAISDLTYTSAFCIGMAQACALIPGVSRSGITIIGGRFFNLDRASATKFSFLLGTPAMAGAALINYKELVSSLGEPLFYVGTVTSTIIGCLAIAFLMQFVKRFSFFLFMIYRFALAALIAILG